MTNSEYILTIIGILITLLYFYWGTIGVDLWIRKRSKWKILEDKFPIKNEPISICFYGTHSEYKSTESNTPLIDSLFKLTPLEKGLFIKMELKYEWPKYYKPIFIPWKNLELFKSDNLGKDGYDIYQIYDNEKLLGNLKIEHFVSDELLEFVRQKDFNLIVHDI